MLTQRAERAVDAAVAQDQRHAGEGPDAEPDRHWEPVLRVAIGRVVDDERFGRFDDETAERVAQSERDAGLDAEGVVEHMAGTPFIAVALCDDHGRQANRVAHQTEEGGNDLAGIRVRARGGSRETSDRGLVLVLDDRHG